MEETFNETFLSKIDDAVEETNVELSDDDSDEDERDNDLIENYIVSPTNKTYK